MFVHQKGSPPVSAMMIRVNLFRHSCSQKTLGDSGTSSLRKINLMWDLKGIDYSKKQEEEIIFGLRIARVQWTWGKDPLSQDPVTKKKKKVPQGKERNGGIHMRLRGPERQCQSMLGTAGLEKHLDYRKICMDSMGMFIYSMR